jgi:hypothetical protein
MTLRNSSTPTLCRILAVLTGLIFLAGCGGGSSGGGGGTTPTAPAVSLSTTSLTFTTSQNVGTSGTLSITVNNTGTATLVFSSFAVTGTNAGDFVAQTSACGASVSAGGSCAISVTFTPSASGTRIATLTITDNASNSPQTVNLSGTGVVPTVSLLPSTLTFASQFQGIQSTPQVVTLTNNTSAVLAISSITASGEFSSPTTTCGSSVAASGGTCTITVTFTPTTAGPLTGTLTVTDNASGSPQTVSLTGTGYSNTVAVNVNFGPNGNTQNPITNYYNGIYATVTVCAPGTTNCVAIPDVLVDTGSVGLRVLSSQLGSLSLPPVTVGGAALDECFSFIDSYTWGPVQMATVQIAGETASQIPAASGGTANSGVPIQVITLNGTPPATVTYQGRSYYTPCTTGNPTPINSDTVTALGANGILGIGNTPQDCGSDCVSQAETSPNYILCPTGTTCELTAVPLAQQVWNPVAAFATTDTNGVVIELPAIGGNPDVGAATVTGSLVFGIGTQTCPGSPPGCTPNALGNAQVYAVDANTSFPSIVFQGVTYYDSAPHYNYSFLDTGSNALYISDNGTLGGISDCYLNGVVSNSNDTGYYCPSSTLNLTGIVVKDYNGVSSLAPISLNIANGQTLFNTGNAAFDNVGGPGGTSPTNDTFDFGLPFFFGRNVYIGISGTTPPTGASAPYGYWAF